MREAPNLDQRKEQITREDVQEGKVGGISTEKADEIFREVETPEARDTRIEELRKEITDKTMPAETMVPGPTGFKPKQEEKSVNKSFKNKVLSFFGQAPEQLSNKYSKLGEERMKGNPALRQAYEKYLSAEGESVAEAYKEAIGKWTYIARDKEGNFVDKTVYSVASGEVNRE